MASLFRWYVGVLKTRPMLANMSTAFVLMAAGDVMAQELEHVDIGDEFVGREHTDIPEDKRLSLKRYGTVNPGLAQAAAIDAAAQKKKAKEVLKTSDETLQPKNPISLDGESNQDSMIEIRNAFVKAINTVADEIQFLDGYRTTTMVFWSTVIYTPTYVQIYRLCDKIMPKHSPATVTARVGISLALSIPINTAFFIYGTFVHHSAEWVALRREWSLELQDMGIPPEAAEHYGSVFPYDWQMMWATARLKMECELYRTVIDSAKVWIPINYLNFGLVPAHLRPAVLMFFSVFWNCYLSLAQHRDLSIPEEGDG